MGPLCLGVVFFRYLIFALRRYVAIISGGEKMLSDIIKVRRDLHRIAELSFEEHLTSNYLRRIEALV